jgi:hypothetical protein
MLPNIGRNKKKRLITDLSWKSVLLLRPMRSGARIKRGSYHRDRVVQMPIIRISLYFSRYRWVQDEVDGAPEILQTCLYSHVPGVLR